MISRLSKMKVAVLLIGVLAIAGQADARGWYGHGYGYGHGGGWGWGGPALLGAVDGGLVVGSVVANSQPVYVQQPVYVHPQPVYIQQPPPVYYQAPPQGYYYAPQPVPAPR